MNKTPIDWVKNPDGTQGYTWNPITGCLNGCEYCYARKLANGRLKERYLANTHLAPHIPKDIKILPTDPFYPRFWEDRLAELPRYIGKQPNTKARGIFVCDMSDLFGIGIPDTWTRAILDRADYYSWYRFYLPTKQPQNLIKFSPFPDNCWVGITVTNDEMFWDALRWLYRIQAKVKFLSIEPFLQPIHIGSPTMIKLDIPNWVIIGAMTFRGGITGSYPQLTAMPYGKRDTLQPKLEWVEEIVRACDKAGVPVFLKDNLKPLLTTEFNGKDVIESHNLWAFKYFKLRQEMPK